MGKKKTRIKLALLLHKSLPDPSQDAHVSTKSKIYSPNRFPYSIVCLFQVFVISFKIAPYDYN